MGTHASIVAESDGKSADGDLFLWHGRLRVDLMAPFGRRLAVYVQNGERAVLILPKEKKVYVSRATPPESPEDLLKRGEILLFINDRRVKIKVIKIEKGFKIPCDTFSPIIPPRYERIQAERPSIKVVPGE